MNCGGGDLISENIQDIFNTIQADDHDQKTEYEYIITVDWMTRKQIDNLPEWDG